MYFCISDLSTAKLGDGNGTPLQYSCLENPMGDLIPGGASANARDIRDAGLIPGLGKSPGGGHGNLLQYSCLENPCGQRSSPQEKLALYLFTTQ